MFFGLILLQTLLLHCDGSCSLHYDNGDIEPSVDLHTVEWCFAGRYCKNFQVDKPINTQPSASVRAASAEPKTCSSKVHKAKGFADDLTVISSKVDSHQQALTSLVLKAADICFEFQPPKCISLHFNGHRVQSSQCLLVILSISVVLTVRNF